MVKVEFIKVSKSTGTNIVLYCESIEEYQEFYKLNFGLYKYIWSHNFPKSDIKQIKNINK